MQVVLLVCKSKSTTYFINAYLRVIHGIDKTDKKAAA